MLLATGAAIATGVARAADYVPGEVVVGYAPGPLASVAMGFATRMGIRVAFTPVPRVEVLRLARGVSVAEAIAELRDRPGVAYAVPNYIAHEAGVWIPDNPGRAHRPGGWEAMQWNFLDAAGVNAPQAWANLIADHRPGGRGVVVAILDTGVAYRNWHQFRRCPGFKGTRFVDPYDFVAYNRFPLDRNGHGTFVAGTVAEATNDGIGLTGLAYGARIMPVRVLDASGNGNATAIAQGIRYAVKHGALVINLSLEFDPGVSAAEIPQIITAIQLQPSRRRGHSRLRQRQRRPARLPGRRPRRNLGRRDHQRPLPGQLLQHRPLK
jgi:serine protease